MKSKIRSECVIDGLEGAIDDEVHLFNEQFTQIQPDKIGLTKMEKRLLRSYLIWKLHVRTEGSQPD